MRGEEFDKKCDDGVSIMEHLDMSKARRPGREENTHNRSVRDMANLIAGLEDLVKRLEAVKDGAEARIAELEEQVAALETAKCSACGTCDYRDTRPKPRGCGPCADPKAGISYYVPDLPTAYSELQGDYAELEEEQTRSGARIAELEAEMLKRRVNRDYMMWDGPGCVDCGCRRESHDPRCDRCIELIDVTAENKRLREALDRIIHTPGYVLRAGERMAAIARQAVAAKPEQEADPCNP